MPLSFDGAELVVNVACGGHGTLQAELQDASGTPLPCFALERSVATWVTSLNETMRGSLAVGAACSLAAAGQRAGGVRLRFVLEDCLLHAFSFAG